MHALVFVCVVVAGGWWLVGEEGSTVMRVEVDLALPRMHGCNGRGTRCVCGVASYLCTSALCCCFLNTPHRPQVRGRL